MKFFGWFAAVRQDGRDGECPPSNRDEPFEGEVIGASLRLGSVDLSQTVPDSRLDLQSVEGSTCLRVSDKRHEVPLRGLGKEVLQIDARQASRAEIGRDFTIGGREKTIEAAAIALEEDEEIGPALRDQVFAAEALGQTADFDLGAVEAQFHEFLTTCAIRADADLEVATKAHRIGYVEA